MDRIIWIRWKLNSVYLILQYRNCPSFQTLLPTIFHNIHAGISTKQIIHYAQIINSGKFQHFDYKDQNTVIYNNPVPPEYPLTLISDLKFHLIYGTKDTLMAVRDVQRLANYLRFTNQVDVLELPNFNHLDYMFGNHVEDILYRPLIDILLDNYLDSVDNINIS